ncbi:hypothetical protein BU23DRAFT_643683 [Bimuria novae-zelandiae CBS 107.79]|uniref:Uncharacterized protein n=1 Tax=Bimuria novae-zelandiae CBS 107.79 TaxID=1447943 RepID=A0A6A5V4U6_9PLEO|nr:hypothetical protein BU23DRAFT_643683 [Bimuria novae-zelandiae CBS 107.79]
MSQPRTGRNMRARKTTIGPAESILRISGLTKDTADLRKEIGDLKKALASANERADEAEAALQANGEQANNEELAQPTTEAPNTSDSIAASMDKRLMMRTERDEEIKGLKADISTHDKDTEKMSLQIFKFHWDSEQAARQLRQAHGHVSALQILLAVTQKGIKLDIRKRAHDNDENNDAQSTSSISAPNAGALPMAKKAKLTHSNKVVPCTQCFTKGWLCDNDNGGSCRNCQLRKKTDGCKRAMCKNFDGNSCKNIDYTFAHEHDGFHHMINYTALEVKPQGPSPVELEAKNAENEKD